MEGKAIGCLSRQASVSQAERRTLGLRIDMRGAQLCAVMKIVRVTLLSRWVQGRNWKIR